MMFVDLIAGNPHETITHPLGPENKRSVHYICGFQKDIVKMLLFHVIFFTLSNITTFILEELLFCQLCLSRSKSEEIYNKGLHNAVLGYGRDNMYSRWTGVNMLLHCRLSDPVKPETSLCMAALLVSCGALWHSISYQAIICST